MGRTLLEDMLYLMGYFTLVAILAIVLCIPLGTGVFVLSEKVWKPCFWPLLLISFAGCAVMSYRIIGRIESAIAKRGGQGFNILGQLGFPLLNYFTRKH